MGFRNEPLLSQERQERRKRGIEKLIAGNSLVPGLRLEWEMQACPLPPPCPVAIFPTGKEKARNRNTVEETPASQEHPLWAIPNQ